jgi:hypothetical protein
MLARDKHANLFQTFINYGRKKFSNIASSSNNLSLTSDATSILGPDKEQVRLLKAGTPFYLYKTTYLNEEVNLPLLMIATHVLHECLYIGLANILAFTTWFIQIGQEFVQELVQELVQGLTLYGEWSYHKLRILGQDNIVLPILLAYVRLFIVTSPRHNQLWGSDNDIDILYAGNTNTA